MIPVGRPPDLRLGPERQRQHRADRPAHAPDVRARAGVEAAVAADAGRHERMRDLQQDGAPPAKHHDRLAVDAVGDHRRRITGAAAPRTGGGRIGSTRRRRGLIAYAQ